jgi:hypothetical protein
VIAANHRHRNRSCSGELDAPPRHSVGEWTGATTDLSTMQVNEYRQFFEWNAGLV